jgi:16S rRNA (adenine1518-N6/adenine1519-N6)-dimethyltransferase
LNKNILQTLRAKKFLGQHFLKNEEIAETIAHSIVGYDSFEKVVEIGPGMGVLTKYLLSYFGNKLFVVELDRDSVPYLQENFPELENRIIEGDFLQFDMQEMFDKPTAVIGNYPYNISTQILFKIFENHNKVPVFSGMFQKEVAARVASKPGNKEYGILSVLLQAFYNIEYLFTVSELEFDPPPRVKSGVMRMIHKENTSLNCNEIFFKEIIKAAFNQRRKTLRNGLKQIAQRNNKLQVLENEIFNKRAEQLSWEAFVDLSNMLE